MTKKRKVAVALASMLGAVIFAVTVIGFVTAGPRTSIISASYPADFSKDEILNARNSFASLPASEKAKMVSGGE